MVLAGVPFVLLNATVVEVVVRVLVVRMFVVVVVVVEDVIAVEGVVLV